jgi:hypothetical protein
MPCPQPRQALLCYSQNQFVIQREKLGWVLVMAFLATGVAAYFLLGSKPDHRLEEIKQDVQSNIRAGMPRSASGILPDSKGNRT